jgi:hypothetical protein
VLEGYRRWFGRIPQRPQRVGYILIDYRIDEAAAFYLATEQVILQELNFPKEIDAVQDSMRSHLGAENWARWESLAGAVNGHLRSVTAIWDDIARRLEPAGQKAGLFPSSRPTEAPVDTYWPALFVEAIWNDPHHFDSNRKHLWEGYEIVKDLAVVPMRHTEDTVQSWIFEGTNLARSQSRESLETIKEAWKLEAQRAGPLIRAKLEERAAIESQAAAFKRLVGGVVEDYQREGKLGGTCRQCEPLLRKEDAAAGPRVDHAISNGEQKPPP